MGKALCDNPMALFEIELLLFLNDRLMAENIITPDMHAGAKEAILKGQKEA
jgi:hypothetical protein